MYLKMKEIYDISMPVTISMPVYGGIAAKKPKLYTDREFTNGNIYESRLELNLHTGTHLDSTLHMVPGGSTIDSLELKQVITGCKVLDFSDKEEKLTAEDFISHYITAGDFLLLKTRNSFEAILEENFIYLDQSGAEYLAKKQIKGVGIDALGIERGQPEHGTHLCLMKAGIQILEGLRLKAVEEGEYLLFAAPVNIVGAEAAPVRAVLLR